MALWTFVLAEPGGGGAEIADLVLAFDRSYQKELTEGGSGSFSMNSSDEQAQAIQVGFHDVLAYRGSNVMDRLRIVSATRSGGDDSVITFQCVGYKAMMDRKKLNSSDYLTNQGQTFAELEQFGWNIVSLAQGHYGGQQGFNIKRGFTEGVGQQTGRYIGSPYPRVLDPGMTVKEALDAAANAASNLAYDDTWEWDILAVGLDLYFTCWYPRRGKTPWDGLASAGTADFFLDNRVNVTSFNIDYDYSNYANYVIVEGSVGNNASFRLYTLAATAGTFTISWRGETSVALPYNSAPGRVEDALNAMASIGDGGVEVYAINAFTDAGATIPTTPSTFARRTVSQYHNLDSGNANGPGGQTTTVAGTASSGSNTRTAYIIRFKGDSYDFRNLEAPVFTNISLSGGLGVGIGISPWTYGYRYSYQAPGDDYNTNPAGVIEFYHFDADLTDQAAIQERGNYLLKQMQVYTPTITCELLELEEGALSVGDYVVIDLRDQGYAVYQTNLRVSSLSFAIGEDGEEGINVETSVVVPIDRSKANLARRVAKKERAEELARQAHLNLITKQKLKLTKVLTGLQSAEKALRAKKASLEKYFKTHGNNKIDSKPDTPRHRLKNGKLSKAPKTHRDPTERKRLNDLAAKIKANKKQQTKVKDAIRKLK